MRQIGDVIVIGERSITMEKSKTNYLYEGVKRTFDIIVALIAVLFLLPVAIVIKIASLLTKDTASIFYKQERIGKNGKSFELYKFRSMVPDADKRLEELLKTNKEAREEYEINKKLKNDPRITKVGKFIRTFSIDELPQVINILKGDMTFIGNRPYLPREKEDMGFFYNSIVSTKPGLTGYWQVSGRSDVTFAKRVELESYYSRHQSLKIDVKIFFKTFKVVLFGKGSR